MADFEKAFARLMRDEGISLSNNHADRGGVTYAGISRKFHPKWEGWKHIDAGSTPPMQLVRNFYHAEYWMVIRGDAINDQRVAEAVFSQFANMGEPAIKLLQMAADCIPDGKIGPKTVTAVNTANAEHLLNRYCIAMVARYHAIGLRDASQRVWWPGWFARALRVAP